jgi:hypothetical protein
LGEGRRLFSGGFPFTNLKLLGVKPTTTGVIVAIYRPQPR